MSTLDQYKAYVTTCAAGGVLPCSYESFAADQAQELLGGAPAPLITPERAIALHDSMFPFVHFQRSEIMANVSKYAQAVGEEVLASARRAGLLAEAEIPASEPAGALGVPGQDDVENTPLATGAGRSASLALVIDRLEQIVATEGEFNENLVDWAKEALEHARPLATSGNTGSVEKAGRAGILTAQNCAARIFLSSAGREGGAEAPAGSAETRMNSSCGAGAGVGVKSRKRAADDIDSEPCNPEIKANLRRARIEAKWQLRKFRREFVSYPIAYLVDDFRMAAWLFENIRVGELVMPEGHVKAMRANLLRKLATAEILVSEAARARVPQTPEEAIAFISSHFNWQREAENLGNVRYDLSVHDLLSAFRWWFDSDLAAGPARTAPLVAIGAAQRTGEDDARVIAAIWDDAKAEAAVYVEAHCVDGAEHARIIMGQPRPTIKLAPASAGKDAELADVLNTTLWLYRRLPQAYGNPPFVDQAILKMAERLGMDDVPAAIKERATLAANTNNGDAP